MVKTEKEKTMRPGRRPKAEKGDTDEALYPIRPGDLVRFRDPARYSTPMPVYADNKLTVEDVSRWVDPSTDGPFLVVAVEVYTRDWYVKDMLPRNPREKLGLPDRINLLVLGQSGCQGWFVMEPPGVFEVIARENAG